MPPRASTLPKRIDPEQVPIFIGFNPRQNAQAFDVCGSGECFVECCNRCAVPLGLFQIGGIVGLQAVFLCQDERKAQIEPRIGGDGQIAQSARRSVGPSGESCP